MRCTKQNPKIFENVIELELLYNKASLFVFRSVIFGHFIFHRWITI